MEKQMQQIHLIQDIFEPKVCGFEFGFQKLIFFFCFYFF